MLSNSFRISLGICRGRGKKKKKKKKGKKRWYSETEVLLAVSGMGGCFDLCF
jgi:hypothetical protein